MANTSRQEEFLAVIRKSQEAVIAVITNLAETVRTADLPKPPSVSVPFADKLPGPEDAVVFPMRRGVRCGRAGKKCGNGSTKSRSTSRVRYARQWQRV